MTGRRFKFVGTAEILQWIAKSEPTYGYLPKADPSWWTVERRPVNWVGYHYLVDIPAENIQFTPENIWYPGHAAALLKGIRDEQLDLLEPPAARVYRVTAEKIKLTQRWARNGELEYQYEMVEPWERGDLRSYYCMLMDGNHRAAAAILAGADTVPVYVSEDYRDNVYKKDYLRP